MRSTSPGAIYFNYAANAAVMAGLLEDLDLRCLEPNGVGTTVKADGTASSSPYDHILANEAATGPEWTGRSGAFYFVPLLYGEAGDRTKASSEVSDHLPVWAEFRTGLADDD